MMTDEQREKAARYFENIASKVRAGDIRVIDWCVSAETREGDDGTWVTVEATGIYNLTVRYQQKPS